MCELDAVKILFDVYSKNENKILEEYFEFLRFKSISAEPESRSQVIACSEWLAAYLRDMGLQVSLWPTNGGYPSIFAEWNGAGTDKPTVLIYGHYDVQPVDPIELWESLPFEPNIRCGNVYARGATDNKGQIFYAIQAVKSYLQNQKTLPVNLKFVIDGEEEIGSPGLSRILEEHSVELKADHLLIVDVGIPDINIPSVTLGVRGIVAMTVEMIGSRTDLHSGAFGGIAYNPNHAMIEVLGKLRLADGKVAVPGFYDDVLEVSKEERERMCESVSPDEFFEKYGVYPSGGESCYTPYESNWLRPTLEINGICGGYFGPGSKTVIPAKAVGKISCRLVPNQRPDVIAERVKSFILSNVPKGISCDVTVHAGVGVAARSNPNCKTIECCARAFSEVFNVKAKFILEGASIPIAARLSEISGAELALIGVGLDSDLIHAPNEHFDLNRMRLGFAVISRIIAIFGE